MGKDIWTLAPTEITEVVKVSSEPMDVHTSRY